MNEVRRKKLKTLGKVVSILVVGGGTLFCYLLISILFGVSVKTIEAVICGGIAVTIWLAVRTILKPEGNKRKYLNRALLLILIGCFGWIGYGYYLDSIPTISDRDLMLYEYTPFREGTKAVQLDEESTLKFAEDQRIRLDGATALYPVYAGFVQAVYPEGEYSRYELMEKGGDEDGYGMVTCSNTVYAYERLLEGKTDVIFVAGPSKAQKEKATEMGMELHLTPIGREAFVFFVNSKNPVEGLTVDEVRGIYSGEITNWKQVGGPRWSIKAFQRAENSGSQTALQTLMGEIPLMEPETENRVSAMDGIIHQVANYRNHKNAIGFSFRYYSTEMVTSNQIRLLALNGVFPTKETIADGTYPVSSTFYAVTASPIGEPAPEDIDDNIAVFLDWICSEQGQKIIEKTGYVPL